MVKPQFTLRAAFVATAVLSVVVCFVITPLYRTNVEQRHRVEVQDALRQIGVALQAYHATWGVYPAATTFDANGRPFASWRTLLLPYLKSSPQYDKYLAWNSAANQAAGAKPDPLFCGPNASSNATRFLAVVGEQTALRERASLRQHEIEFPAIAIIVVQVESSKIPWTQPGDISVDDLRARLKQRNLGDSTCFRALFADGAVHAITYEMDSRQLRDLCNADEYPVRNFGIVDPPEPPRVYGPLPR